VKFLILFKSFGSFRGLRSQLCLFLAECFYFMLKGSNSGILALKFFRVSLPGNVSNDVSLTSARRKKGRGETGQQTYTPADNKRENRQPSENKTKALTAA
jgi:hypothetical protein